MLFPRVKGKLWIGSKSSENFAAMLNLSWRNMLLPISLKLCCLDFNHEVFQNYSVVLYSSWRNVLLAISENLCCLDSDHEVYNWICYLIQVLKELLNEPPCVCIIRCILDGFFFIHTTPLLWSCKYQLLCSLKTYQFLVFYEWPSVFSKQFISLLLDSVFFYRSLK